MFFLGNKVRYHSEIEMLDEEFLDKAYVQWLSLPHKDFPCMGRICLHVSELTYGTKRSDGGLQPTMVIGVEAERGMHFTYLLRRGLESPVEFVPGFTVISIFETSKYGEVLIIGNPDFFVHIRETNTWIVGEKKTGSYRGYRDRNGSGFKKQTIALGQLILYAYLTGIPLGVIQSDVPRQNSDGKLYLVTHELYKIEIDSPELEETIEKRIECAVDSILTGKESWWECVQRYGLTRFAHRFGRLRQKAGLLKWFS